MEERIIDEAEKASWTYHPRLKDFDTGLVDYYTSRNGKLRFYLGVHYTVITLFCLEDLTIVKETSSGLKLSIGNKHYSRLASICNKKRLNGLYGKLERQRLSNEKERKRMLEKERKEEADKIERGNLETVLKLMGGK